MENFVSYCKNYILENIDEFDGQTHYACDFAYELTNEPNVNGSLTFSRQKAMDYLGEWWDDAASYWQYENDNFGEHTHNPFDEPEAYMVCMVIEGCNAILAQAPFISDNWNDEVMFDKDAIDSIKDFVSGIDEGTSLF